MKEVVAIYFKERKVSRKHTKAEKSVEVHWIVVFSSVDTIIYQVEFKEVRKNVILVVFFSEKQCVTKGSKKMERKRVCGTN